MFYLDMAEIPDETRTALHRLAKIILSLACEACPQEPPTGFLPIEVHINRGHDSAHHYIKRLSEGWAYAFGPTTRSPLHHIVVTRAAIAPGGECCFAVEFAHELAHILFDVRHNNSLIETLCIAFSLYILEQLAQYARTYPDLGVKSEGFLRCRDREIYGRMFTFPPEVQNAVSHHLWHPVSLYLRYKREEADACRYETSDDYRFAALGAAVLNADRVPWADLAGIGTHGLLVGTAGGEERWQIDTVRLTSSAQAALRHLGHGPTTDLMAARFTNPTSWTWDGFWLWENGERLWLLEVPTANREKWKKKLALLRPESVVWENAQPLVSVA